MAVKKKISHQNAIMQDDIKSNHIVKYHIQGVCICVCFCTAMVDICMCTFQVQAWEGFVCFQMHLKVSQPAIQNTF